MKRFLIFFSLLLAFGIGGSLCFIAPGLLSNKSPIPFLESIKKNQSIKLFEGLPHQMFEKDLLKKELSSKSVKKIGNYPFYENHLNMSKEDQVQLLKELKSPKAYLDFSGPKLCGGFHPDYATRFTTNNKHYDILICFGCHEIILTSHNHFSRHDIKESSFKILQQLLSKYVKYRPKN